jgi:hypothetical protein
MEGAQLTKTLHLIMELESAVLGPMNSLALPAS